MDFSLLPKYGLRGEPLNDEMEFFAISDKIGEVLYGHSNFFKSSPLKDKNKKNILGFLKTYEYENILVGTNGFVILTIQDYLDNIVCKNEIIFDECTDFFISRTDVVQYFIYQRTNVVMVFVNRETNKIIYQNGGEYYKKKNIENQIWHNFPNCVEKNWTLHLLNKLENEINEKGYLSFFVHNGKDKIHEYLQISEDKIVFLQNKKPPFMYEKKDIKSMYMKGYEIVVEHNDFKKGFLGFNSGNAHTIPLSTILNRQFLFRAIEKLLNYKIS